MAWTRRQLSRFISYRSKLQPTLMRPRRSRVNQSADPAAANRKRKLLNGAKGRPAKCNREAWGRGSTHHQKRQTERSHELDGNARITVTQRHGLQAAAACLLAPRLASLCKRPAPVFIYSPPPGYQLLPNHRSTTEQSIVHLSKGLPS